MSRLMPLAVWALFVAVVVTLILAPLIGLIALVGLLLGAAILRAILMRGKVYDEGTVMIDHAIVFVTVAMGSKLPKVLGAAATTAAKDYICCRDYAARLPQTVVGRGKISPLLIAHECYHIVSRRRRGFRRFWFRFYVDWLLLKSHDDQREEMEAIASAPSILAGTYPGVDASVLLTRFQG